MSASRHPARLPRLRARSRWRQPARSRHGKPANRGGRRDRVSPRQSRSCAFHPMECQRLRTRGQRNATRAPSPAANRIEISRHCTLLTPPARVAKQIAASGATLSCEKLVYLPVESALAPLLGGRPDDLFTESEPARGAQGSLGRARPLRRTRAAKQNCPDALECVGGSTPVTAPAPVNESPQPSGERRARLAAGSDTSGVGMWGRD